MALDLGVFHKNSKPSCQTGGETRYNVNSVLRAAGRTRLNGTVRERSMRDRGGALHDSRNRGFKK